jgi:cell division protein FtsB
VALVGTAVLVLFALFAGEYSTLDWWKLRGQLIDERAQVQVLEVQLDSLTREAHDLEINPAAQYRVVRELFVMIGPGEIFYRLVPRAP